ncbi:hypothetical protein SARC_02537 [Sphaeroforma arctica JP610]|uniref:Proteasome assembly chaperone 2 n=1 Tax=Sphaeroforma arctica JP610 TaxID=667725 RepID=A0A0L0GAJ9_9EUKA|nr:hypothetical protein SARC_02537 [Sphaeroforma arctica JP610]KNC85278.1 hypothetical protein SARC_02537 [Sphaeroforma arctica JP610]|eukprot:XP_014159180.1 hypothetical protein SARC_02537 [Sphaeroforma arctica JP610]
MQQQSCNSIFVHCDDVPDFSGYTLVLPAVSIGNVPQLTVDLLISTLAPKRVGFLHDRALLPVFGCDAYSESGHNSTTSADVYMCEEKQLAIIQQRSPAIKSQRRHLADRMTEWITAANFGSVVLLTSSDANNSGDNTMLANSASLRYVGNQHQDITNNFAQFGWQPWAPVSSSAPYLMAEERARLEKQRVTGGGLTRSLYDACEEKTIPLVTLVSGRGAQWDFKGFV